MNIFHCELEPIETYSTGARLGRKKRREGEGEGGGLQRASGICTCVIKPSTNISIHYRVTKESSLANVGKESGGSGTHLLEESLCEILQHNAITATKKTQQARQKAGRGRGSVTVAITISGYLAAKKARTILMKCCSPALSFTQSFMSEPRSISSAVHRLASCFLYIFHTLSPRRARSQTKPP